jgi:hypothetical protein
VADQLGERCSQGRRRGSGQQLIQGDGIIQEK